MLTKQIAFHLEPGQYNLRYEGFAPFGDLQGRIKFVFIRTDAPSFAVLRADSGLKPDGDLLLTAEPG